MDYDKLLQGILDIGEEMVVCGAEVNRVEDSIYRMCESYGADRINVFIITSNIQVTMEAPDGRILTHIRRLVRYDVNFDRLDYLNDLCRYVCAKTPDVGELQNKLTDVLARPEPPKFMHSFLSQTDVSLSFPFGSYGAVSGYYAQSPTGYFALPHSLSLGIRTSGILYPLSDPQNFPLPGYSGSPATRSLRH